LAYCCPQCKWQWKRLDYYVVRSGTFKTLPDLKEYKAINRGDLVYPIKLDTFSNVAGITCWREIHFCPNCQLEFEYDINTDVELRIIKSFRRKS